MADADFTFIIPEKEIERALKKLKNLTTDKTLLAFGEIGERVVNDARTNKDYEDQTANLKSSTGYVLIDGTKFVKQDYKNVNGSVKSELDGAKIGLEIAKNANETKRGEVGLIIDSGMDYSDEVESKGYNVLTAFIPAISEYAKTIEKRFK